MTKSKHVANPVGTTRRKTEKHRNGVKQENISIENKRFVRRNALIINRPKRRFFVIPKKIIKTKVLTANYSRQNDCKIIITDIITHIPCCYIEKIRIIKSAIQKTYILVFILKHGEK